MLGISNTSSTLIMYIVTILILLLSLTFHELGHYVFARLFKVNVKEFSMGIGPRIKTWTTKKGMRISIRAIPVIAYVMIDSKRIRDIYKNEKNDKDYRFYMQPVPKYSKLLEKTKVWQYLLIMLGGVLFNFILFGITWYILAVGMHWNHNPFISIGLSFEAIGQNMIFIGNGDIFGNMPTPSGSLSWSYIILSIIMMMNLVTFVFNLIPFPPLDGWKIVAELYQKTTHKKINETLELILSMIGFLIVIYIFISGIICDFIHR